MEFKCGDQVVIKFPFWYLGENLGNRLGKVICTKSYIMVEIHGYYSNPVKCTKNEVEKVSSHASSQDDFSQNEIEDWFDKTFTT